jgi:hypothetical protein
MFSSISDAELIAATLYDPNVQDQEQEFEPVDELAQMERQDNFENRQNRKQ